MYSNIKVYQKYLATSIKVGCATRSLYASSGPKAEGVPTNNQRGRSKMLVCHAPVFNRKLKSPETRQVQEKLVSTLEHLPVPKWDRTRCPEEKASPVTLDWSIILVSMERSCHKEYTCVILKLYRLLLKSYGQE